MNRRFFLTWLGLGFLASASLKTIATIAHQQEEHSTVNSSASANAIRFYVACNGNDRWTGTKETPDLVNQDGPFATLHRAQAAIRVMRQQGGLQQPVTVLVRGGTHFLSEPLKFAPEDSGTKDFPITYQAYPGERPIISGGKAIAGEWRREGDIWTTNLPEVRAGKWYFRLLRVNDDWATRARYPNESQNLFAKSWLYAKPPQPKPVPIEQGNFNSSVGSIHNRGDRLEWNISVPTSGIYRVWLRYSNNMQAYGLKSMGARTSLKAGNNPPVLLKNLSDTGSFATFRWQSVARIPLNAGEQKLVWQNLKGGGLGLDAFVLTDDFNWNPVTAIAMNTANKAQVKPVRSGKHLIVVHAETFSEVSAKELTVFPQQQHRRIHLTTAPDRFFDWDWSGAEIHVFPDRGWVNAILPVDKVDPETNTIYVKSQQDLKPGNRFFIANTREALDSPHEWYLERSTGKLHYYPTNPQFPRNTEIVAPRLDRLIVLQGDRQKQKYVENVHFVGLTFSDTNYTLASNYYFPADAAIWFSTTRQCSIRKCNFVRLGGYGVRLQDRSYRNSIIANSMTQLGQGGVILLGNTDTQPYDNSIAANKIGEGGKVYKHVAGVYVTTGSGNRIAHNQIDRMPRYGISLKSFSSDRYSHNNIVEFNEITNTCLETSDTGAIETLGRDRQASGNIIRYNFIRDVVGMGTTKQGKTVSPYYTWGIYLDDHSSGTVVYGNIVVNTVLGGVMIHSGRNNSIQNNIFVGGSRSQIQVSPEDEFMQGNLVRRNMFIYHQSDALLWNSNQKWRPSILEASDFNLYWHTGSIDLAKTDKEITPEGNFTQWQNAGFDLHSIFAEPPFINALKQKSEQILPQDFMLDCNDELVKQLNFQPIPVAKIGISGFGR